MSDDGYVYAISHPHGYFKVGRSKNPFDRTSQIQTGSPHELELRYVLKYLHSRFRTDAERAVQDQLESFHHRGEWYDCDISTVVRAFHAVLQNDDAEGYHIIDVTAATERRNGNPYSYINRRPTL